MQKEQEKEEEEQKEEMQTLLFGKKYKKYV